MFYYNISTTYQKNGDLFCPAGICGFQMVSELCPCNLFDLDMGVLSFKISKNHHTGLLSPSFGPGGCEKQCIYACREKRHKKCSILVN